MKLKALYHLNFSPVAEGTSFSLGITPAQWPSSYKWLSCVGDWIPGMAHWITSFSWNPQNWCCSQSLCIGLFPLLRMLFQVFSSGHFPFQFSDLSSESISFEMSSLMTLKYSLMTEGTSVCFVHCCVPSTWNSAGTWQTLHKYLRNY